MVMLKLPFEGIQVTVFSNMNFFFFFEKNWSKDKVTIVISFQIMYRIIEMSTIKTGVFNILISHCCKSWIVSASNVPLSTAKNYSELVYEACIFGTVFRRDQR